MKTPQIYPHNFEQKIGLTEVRSWIASFCSSTLGKELVEGITPSYDYEEVKGWLEEAGEMLRLIQGEGHLPSLNLVDCRLALGRIRPDRTYMEERELLDLGQMLEALHALHHYFVVEMTTGEAHLESLEFRYPHLAKLLVDAPLFPKVAQAISQLFDPEGRIKDTASRELLSIRRNLRETERSLSGILQRIMRSARAEGWVDSDVQPALRDGRLVIPLAPEHKRKIRGIVHDESSSGKTVYVEPMELVEANNQIRDLEGQERKEVVRILLEIASRLRPNISHLLRAYDIVARFDLIQAKARWATQLGAISPTLSNRPHLNWQGARHPLLERSLRASGGAVVPLDIRLDEQEGRLLLISGPNAGGKSVCLKTVGLLQYMLQSGLPIPVLETTEAGIFRNFFIDIGDEQSLEDDLSTYSSHLSNMKHFVRESDQHTLLLIDEFGSGTEPTIGAAIALALLEQFNDKGAYGVITTHYQSLKTFAEETAGIVNGAMLYDRHLMRPLFRLSIGRPGSSFAIEIARKIGLPEVVIARATEQVGSDYIDMDKYLQDIIRDKRYWESKRQSIRKEEKRLEEAIERYSHKAERTEAERQKILSEARTEAERIIQEAGGRIERTIKEIREAQAEKNRTQSIRAELRDFQATLTQAEEEAQQRKQEASERAQREMEKLLRRRQRKADGGGGRAEAEEEALRQIRKSTGVSLSTAPDSPSKPEGFAVGDLVRLEGQKSIATITALSKREATIEIGLIKMNVPPSRLRPVSASEARQSKVLERTPSKPDGVKSVVDMIHDKRLSFRNEIDVRGMRAGEALDLVADFIDDALQLGVSPLRILHGTGTGALRTAIRQYLSSQPSVRRYADEHVQLGGAGITIVEII